jgi:hypothetical protein
MEKECTTFPQPEISEFAFSKYLSNENSESRAVIHLAGSNPWLREEKTQGSAAAQNKL